MIRTYLAKKTIDLLPAGLNRSVVSMVKGQEFSYDDAQVEADIPSEFYEATETWKKLVIPVTASGVAFSVEKEIEINPFFDTVKGITNFVRSISCGSKAPVAITNFKIEITTYNGSVTKSTWVQQINALGTSTVLNGASATSQTINIGDLPLATKVKIKISGTPNANIESATDFIIYPVNFPNRDYKQEIKPEEQVNFFTGLNRGDTENLYGVLRTKAITNTPVKGVDFDVTLDVIGRKDGAELSNLKHTYKIALVRAGTTASVVALSGTEKYELKTEGFGASGILINKNTGGSVIEALVSYVGELTFTIQLATAGWYNLMALDPNSRFLMPVCSFYVNNA